jgi:hypothetical protein
VFSDVPAALSLWASVKEYSKIFQKKTRRNVVFIKYHYKLDIKGSVQQKLR